MATIMVEPSRFILKVEPGKKETGAINVINAGKTPATLRVVLYDWDLDEDGNLSEVNPGTYSDSLEKLIKFNPKQFTVQPGQSQVVRFTIDGPTDGIEHKGIVFFEETLALPGDSLGANVTSMIGTTIYVAPTKILRAIRFLEMDVKIDGQVRYVVKAINEGDGHLRFSTSYKLQTENGKTLKEGSFKEEVLLPKHTLALEYPLTDLSSGKYRLLLQMRFYGINNTYDEAIEFSIP